MEVGVEAEVDVWEGGIGVMLDEDEGGEDVGWNEGSCKGFDGEVGR